MAKYLKDRKKEKRKLSLEEIEHYMKVAKAIERTIEVQGEVGRRFLVKCSRQFVANCQSR
jgi:hypothetical protein